MKFDEWLNTQSVPEYMREEWLPVVRAAFDTIPTTSAVEIECPVSELIALYHCHMPDNPKVKVVTASRRSAIKQRWREAAKFVDVGPFGYKAREEGLAAWGKFFEVCSRSDFLSGRTESRDGRPAFIADIDFLMSPSGFIKILENKYHR